MGKFILRFFLLSLVAIILLAIFLAYFGFETDRFNVLIKNKANEINQYTKLEFQKTKIHFSLYFLWVYIHNYTHLDL